VTMTCTHATVRCINPYELIRKYECASCGAVMMCGCDEEFGIKFLPHQLAHAQVLDSGMRISVTGGFQAGVCNSCRGIPEVPTPKAEMFGATSKVKRYYWREIYMETTRRFAAWCEQNEVPKAKAAPRDHADVRDRIEDEVIEEIKTLHETNPKYEYHEKSQEQILRENHVDLVTLAAEYAQGAARKSQLMLRGTPMSAEAFAAEHYRSLGFEVLHTESRPIHALFGTMMWLLLQGPDRYSRLITFGDRFSSDDGVERPPIMTRLPVDFGRSGYVERMQNEVGEHFTLLGKDRTELQWLFDYWSFHSVGLRQYLWAHRDEDMEKARVLVSVLPVEKTLAILAYLIKGYWHRYLGWPDLFIYDGTQFFFAEVKSAGDRLSEDQKNWIAGNKAEIGLPFKLVKIRNARRSRCS
jgi:hypothetical protein